MLIKENMYLRAHAGSYFIRNGADYKAAFNYRMLIYSRPLSLYQISHAYEQSNSGWNMSWSDAPPFYYLFLD